MCSFASVMECLLHLLVLEEQSWSKQATNGISSQISTIETTRRKALLFIYFLVSSGLAISKNAGSDQKGLCESMRGTHGLWCCWVRVFLLHCGKLGRVTAGEMHGENSKFSYVLDKICPVGFGQGWWVCQVVQGAFCIWFLGSCRGRTRPQKQIWSMRWKMPVKGTSTAYCLPRNTQHNCPPCFCILLCKTYASLLSAPTWDKRKQSWVR